MTDFKVALAEFSARQAEREAKAQIELQHLKLAVIPCLRQAGIAKVEIRFDGSGDSGAVEEIVCLWLMAPLRAEWVPSWTTSPTTVQGAWLWSVSSSIRSRATL